jgi:hypothetical protein
MKLQLFKSLYLELGSYLLWFVLSIKCNTFKIFIKYLFYIQ